jgi:hypothetical protein
LLFVIVWLPFINGLSTEVHQTKRILLLIPIELLIGMKNVALLLGADKDTKNSSSSLSGVGGGASGGESQSGIGGSGKKSTPTDD